MKAKRLFYILMCLPTVIAIAAYSYLPEQIPAHFNVQGVVDRWSSRAEIFILPVVAIVLGILMILIARHLRKQERFGNNNEKITYIIGSCAMLMFTVILCSMIYTSFKVTSSVSNMPGIVHKALFIAIGVLFIVMGNVLPKSKKNSWLGIRTKYSMESEENWRKSQRVGAIVMFVVGVVITVYGLLS